MQLIEEYNTFAIALGIVLDEEILRLTNSNPESRMVVNAIISFAKRFRDEWLSSKKPDDDALFNLMFETSSEFRKLLGERAHHLERIKKKIIKVRNSVGHAEKSILDIITQLSSDIMLYARCAEGIFPVETANVAIKSTESTDPVLYVNAGRCFGDMSKILQKLQEAIVTIQRV